MSGRSSPRWSPAASSNPGILLGRASTGAIREPQARPAAAFQVRPLSRQMTSVLTGSLGPAAHRCGAADADASGKHLEIMTYLASRRRKGRRHDGGGAYAAAIPARL